MKNKCRPPGIEPATCFVASESANHYTMRNLIKINERQLVRWSWWSALTGTIVLRAIGRSLQRAHITSGSQLTNEFDTFLDLIWSWIVRTWWSRPFWNRLWKLSCPFYGIVAWFIMPEVISQRLAMLYLNTWSSACHRDLNNYQSD